MFNNVFEDYNILFTRYLKFFDFDFTYYPTNSLITFFLVTFFFFYISNRFFISFNKFNNLLFFFLKPIYGIIYSLVKTNLGNRKLYYCSFFFYLFLFIFFNNLFGILPFTFTQTSHLTSTLFLSSIIWFICLIKSFMNHGLYFFSLFCPSGVAGAIKPLLVLIESISFFFRLFSLGIRLFANIFAGHVLLETVGVFIYKMFFSISSGLTLYDIFFSIIPITFFMILFFFETIVAFLQSYIFTILSIIYLSESYNLH